MAAQQLIQAGLSTVSGLIMGVDDANKRRQLEAKIAKLTLAQQKELEIRLQNVQSDIAKMQILYQTLAIDKNREALVEMNKQKTKGLIALGIGFTILAIVVIAVKHKQS